MQNKKINIMKKISTINTIQSEKFAFSMLQEYFKESSNEEISTHLVMLHLWFDKLIVNCTVPSNTVGTDSLLWGISR